MWGSVAAVALLVTVTTAFVWSKVSLSDIARRTSAARTRVESLSVERARLMAEVVMETKPGIIKEIAATRLGMIEAKETGLHVDLEHFGGTDG
jgi:cell division protein FtsB